MALLTAAELKDSREAREAGVDTVSDTDATNAITEATAELHALLRFKIEDATTSYTFRGPRKHLLYLPAKARSISSITEDGTATLAVDYHTSSDGWLLVRESGTWSAEAIVVTGTFGFTSSDDEWVLAKKAVRLLAVAALVTSSDEGNMPAAAAGALLTGFSSEQASFQFFTPSSELSGHPAVDRLLEMIRKISGYAFLSKKVLISVPLVGREGDDRYYLAG